MTSVEEGKLTVFYAVPRLDGQASALSSMKPGRAHAGRDRQMMHVNNYPFRRHSWICIQTHTAVPQGHGGRSYRTDGKRRVPSVAFSKRKRMPDSSGRGLGVFSICATASLHGYVIPPASQSRVIPANIDWASPTTSCSDSPSSIQSVRPRHRALRPPHFHVSGRHKSRLGRLRRRLADPGPSFHCHLLACVPLRLV
ncbi:cAMP-specific 3',5'-cyclic phosphodiesterase 4D-like isoform X2 [Arapaima gigas]